MLSPPEIRALCERKYPAFLRSVVTGEPFFPLKIAFGRPTSSDDFRKLDAEITALDKATLGYRIDWEHVNTRLYGRQRLPQRVWFDDEPAFLKAVGKQAEVDEFRRLISHTRGTCPELTGWLPTNASRLIEQASIWTQLLLVCRYFLSNPRPARYARELPIAVDTKFIERHERILRNLLDYLLPPEAKIDTPHFETRFGLRFEEPRVRFRILDPELQRSLHLAFDDLEVPLTQFANFGLKEITVIVAENKKPFFTLPTQANTIGVFGNGAAAE